VKKLFFIALATLVTWLATISTAFACSWNFYEPPVPDELGDNA